MYLSKESLKTLWCTAANKSNMFCSQINPKLAGRVHILASFYLAGKWAHLTQKSWLHGYHERHTNLCDDVSLSKAYVDHLETNKCFISHPMLSYYSARWSVCTSGYNKQRKFIWGDHILILRSILKIAFGRSHIFCPWAGLSEEPHITIPQESGTHIQLITIINLLTS